MSNRTDISAQRSPASFSRSALQALADRVVVDHDAMKATDPDWWPLASHAIEYAVPFDVGDGTLTAKLAIDTSGDLNLDFRRHTDTGAIWEAHIGVPSKNVPRDLQRLCALFAQIIDGAPALLAAWERSRGQMATVLDNAASEGGTP